MIRIQITYFSLLTCFLTLGLTISACSQSREWVPGDTEFYEPVPPIVEAKPVFMQPPSDATILFDGSDLSAWESINGGAADWTLENGAMRSEEHTSELQSRGHRVCRLLLEKKK